MTAISMRQSISDTRVYWNYKRRDTSFQPMEISVNPSYRRLRSEKWEASPFTAGSSHVPGIIYISILAISVIAPIMLI